MTMNRVGLVTLVVALAAVVLASHGRAGHVWLPVLVLLLAIAWLLIIELRAGLAALRREARRK